MLDRITALRPRRILDLATRRGHLAQRCRELGAEVVGIDRSSPEPGSVDAFHRADLEQEDLPVDPHEFDVLLAVDLLEDLALPSGCCSSCATRAAPPATPTSRPGCW